MPRCSERWLKGPALIHISGAMKTSTAVFFPRQGIGGTMRRSGQGILVAEFGRKEDERAGTPYGVYKISTAAKAVLPKLSRQGASYCCDSPELLTATQAGSTSDLFDRISTSNMASRRNVTIGAAGASQRSWRTVIPSLPELGGNIQVD